MPARYRIYHFTALRMQITPFIANKGIAYCHALAAELWPLFTSGTASMWFAYHRICPNVADGLYMTHTIDDHPFHRRMHDPSLFPRR